MRCRILLSESCFSAACTAAIVHKNHFFHLHQQNKSPESKVKLRQANKTKESIIFQKCGSWDFWQIANSVLNKDKSAVSPLFNGLEVLPFASNKVKLLTFLGTLFLMTWLSPYLFSLLEVI